MLTFALMLLLPLSSQAWFFDGVRERLNAFRDKWNGLEVTWDPNIFNSVDGFSDLPRKVSDATDQGFTANSNTCEASETKPYLGTRYLKDGDQAVMLLYDKNGYIAGLQVGMTNEPSEINYELARPPWLEEGQNYILTVYFVDPSIICTTGRTQEEFDEQGTGTDLYVQNGTNPTLNSIKMESNESNVGETMWTRGKCFRSMGIHYWYNLRADMSCDRMFPMFLLYNNGNLNGFGWAILRNLTSPRFEHPAQNVFKLFMDPPATCLEDAGTISTMHVYLSGSAAVRSWC